MNIGLISANRESGKIKDGFPGRLEFAWANCLNAEVIHLDLVMSKNLDIAIFILPKQDRSYDRLPLDYKKRNPNCKVGIMQEGPVDYFQEFDIKNKFSYLNMLSSVDFLMVHNYDDQIYLEELFGYDKKIYVLKTVYDATLVPKPMDFSLREGIIVSGACSSWYGGTFGIYNILKNYPKVSISIPTSGRMYQEEKILLESLGVNIIPWQGWPQWMQTLNRFKIGINLMSTRAAGTFSMNCASLKIPCIGYKDLDTQRENHRYLSIEKSHNFGFSNKLKLLMEPRKAFLPSVSETWTRCSVESNRPNFKRMMEKIYGE